jgi:competence protein ComEC
MNNTLLRLGLKLAGAAAVAALLITVACTKINTNPQHAVAPLPQNNEAAVAKAPLRTKEVFDRDKYRGLLTIRYLFMDNKVASGDCILIQTPDGKTMMIDSGIPETGVQVVKYLDNLGINTIDVALNTHPHSDHIGGFATVFQKKEVKLFYSENLPYPDSGAYRNTMSQVEKKHIPHQILEEGDSFQVGNDVKFEVFSPDKGVLPDAVKTFDASVLNYYSLVIKMTYKDNSFLFPADVYKDRELQLIESKGKALDADMMSAPHHGNATSSSSSFVEAVSPQVAILSSNIFNSLLVKRLYEKNNAKVYSTALNGNILITSDGKKLNVITEKDGSAK